MEKPFKTSDLGKAAYLVYRGMILLGCIDSGQKNRLLFVFTDDPQREAYEEEWTTGQDMVSAARYMRTLRSCKKRLQEQVTI